MTAIADVQYVRTKIRDSERAEERTRSRARDAFGADGKAIVDRVMRVTASRLENDNPELWGSEAGRRSR